MSASFDVRQGRAPLRVGDLCPAKTVGPLTRVDIARYAGAGGDFVPLHTDEAFAQRNGFPSVFAMGLLGAGVVAQTLAAWVGQQNVRTYGVRFTSQVWPGDVLSVEGKVERIDDTAGERRAVVRLSLLRQTGEAAMTATASIAVD